jgi:uncharacterized coiled-coil protein SlyX
MGDWDNLVEPTRGALEALLRKGDAMADRIEELEAKLAKVEEDRDDLQIALASLRMQLDMERYISELKGQNQ